tara:strand:+ start:221 stop:598 length:378 start_codon:yes stop_codon:yes gene_type:complete
MTNDFKNLHMNINDQDIVIRMQPSLDSNGNWTGDVHLSVIDSPANPLSDDDYNELMFFARMCLVGIDLVRSDIDFSKRVFKIVEDEIYEEKRKRQNSVPVPIMSRHDNVIKVDFRSMKNKLNGSA